MLACGLAVTSGLALGTAARRRAAVRGREAPPAPAPGAASYFDLARKD